MLSSTGYSDRDCLVYMSCKPDTSYVQHPFSVSLLIKDGFNSKYLLRVIHQFNNKRPAETFSSQNICTRLKARYNEVCLHAHLYLSVCGLNMKISSKGCFVSKQWQD